MKVHDIINNNAIWKPSKDYDSKQPLVSVLLPTFRRAKSGLFAEAVYSVLNQELKDLELIIIDDASTDGTEEQIRFFMDYDPRVSCIRHKYNVGLPAISEYEGYMKARGRYIAFIFDDNVWEKDFLNKTIVYMGIHHVEASYGIIRSYYGTGKDYVELGQTDLGCGMHMLPYTNYIGNGSVVLSRNVIEEVGLYDPHVVMTRLCDWNLWKRIARKYQFAGTGILAGTEKGVTQNDSLGNSYKMNHWALAEREAQQSDEMFKPCNFEDLDIASLGENYSEFYCEAVHSQYGFFQNKDWYVSRKFLKTAKGPLRVMVIANVYDATMELAFLRLRGIDNNIVFRYENGYVQPIEVGQADAVILVRNMVALDHVKKLCMKAGIPCWLYLDDNFIELAKENKDDSELQMLSERLSAKQLKEFDGIFTSTKNLKVYFEHMNCGVPVITLPPCTGMLQQRNDLKQNTPCVVAYMGGPFRDETFMDIVMPAICRLASERKMKLVCPDRLDLKRFSSIRGLDIEQIPYSLSLSELLMRCYRHKPNFLLHCGPDIQNNAYKTENAMINAVQLGSVLVASNASVYEREHGLSCVCSENSPEAWYEQINKLLSDSSLMERLYANACKRIKENYSPIIAAEILKNAMSTVKEANMYDILQRVCGLSQQLNQGNTGNIANESRLLGRTSLSFTGKIEKRRKYRLVCRKDVLSEVGICFASLGKAVGNVTMEIYDNGRMIRESVLQMEDMQWNNWNYFTFSPIDFARDRVFDIVLNFQYFENSEGIGLFEEQKKRTVLYRALNKFGIRLKIKDLLYADCR